MEHLKLWPGFVGLQPGFVGSPSLATSRFFSRVCVCGGVDFGVISLVDSCFLLFLCQL